MRELRVALYGVGAIGREIALNLLERKGVRIVGAIDIDVNKVGKDLGEVLRVGRELGVKVVDSPERVFGEERVDVAIHATKSFLREVYPQLLSIIEHGVNVVSTCEELTYPYLSEPGLASKIDSLAKKMGVTVLGTGINPGFLMDTLVACLTSVCLKIESISVSRILDASKRRKPFQVKVGVGLTREEFVEKMEKGEITGHVGLRESIALIAKALCWELDEVRCEEAEPLVAEEELRVNGVWVEKGRVKGLRQKAFGFIDGRRVISLDFQAYVGADELDSIRIKGIPEVNQFIKPCIHGDKGTAAVIINVLPKVVKAHPGLITMLDLTIPRAVLSDYSKYLVE